MSETKSNKKRNFYSKIKNMNKDGKMLISALI